MAKTKKMEYSKHLELGKLLRDDNNKYSHLGVEISRIYGKTSKESRIFEKLYKLLMDIRTTMDGKFWLEYKGEIKDSDYGTYY